VDKATAAPQTAPDMNPDAVVAWLRAHPSFIADNPGLFDFLSPPRAQGGGVVELQRVMVERLQGRNAELHDAADALITMGRTNMAAQQAMQRAVLQLLDATSLSHLVHIVTQDCPETLDVDVITLSVEYDGPLPQPLLAGGVFAIRPGEAAQYLDGEKWVALRPHVAGAEGLYGPATDLVKSDLLARLRIGPEGPWGLLAFGSRTEGKFQPHQGTDLVLFFVRAVEACVKLWLTQGLR